MSKVYARILLDDMVLRQSLPVPLAREASKAILALIREGLIRDGLVRISNFGTFRLKAVAARQGINPQTGETLTIPAHQRVIFVPCKALRERIEPLYLPPVPIEPGQERPRDSLVSAAAPVMPVPLSSAASPSDGNQADGPQPEHPSEHTLAEMPDSRTANLQQGEAGEPGSRPVFSSASGAVYPTGLNPQEDDKQETSERPPQTGPDDAAPVALSAIVIQPEDGQRERPEVLTAIDLQKDRPIAGAKSASAKRYYYLGGAGIAIIVLFSAGLLMEFERKDDQTVPDTAATRTVSEPPATVVAMSESVPDHVSKSVTEIEAEAEADLLAEPEAKALAESVAEPVAKPAEAPEALLMMEPVAALQEASEAESEAGAEAELVAEFAAEAKPETGLPTPSREASGDTQQAPGEGVVAEEGGALSLADMPAPVIRNEGLAMQSVGDFFIERAHEVARGESLWRLAGRHYQDPLLWPHIYQANHPAITDPDHLPVGSVITIPGLQGSPRQLSRVDRRHIATGYYLVYQHYKAFDHEDAFFALLEAKRYDQTVVEVDHGLMHLSMMDAYQLSPPRMMPF